MVAGELFQAEELTDLGDKSFDIAESVRGWGDRRDEEVEHREICRAVKLLYRMLSCHIFVPTHRRYSAKNPTSHTLGTLGDRHMLM